MKVFPITLAATTLAAGCMPPPVKAVDRWLEAYAEGDRDALLNQTTPEDRPTLELCVDALEHTPTSSLALALPPRPHGHTIEGIADKVPGRWVVDTKLTVDNPLPSASEKVGQKLPGIPKTRKLRKRWLVVESDDQWGVKLDLDRVLLRANFAAQLLRYIAEGRLQQAEAALAEGVPAPPDNGEGQGQTDRLVDELKRRIAEARARREAKQ